jgi:hypothetical protein
METAMNVQNLTLVVNMAGTGPTYDAPEWRNSEEPCTWAQWLAYERILAPFQILGEAGLMDFFLYLRRFDSRYAERIKWENRIEKAVMGANYDSSKRGKKEDERFTALFARVHNPNSYRHSPTNFLDTWGPNAFAWGRFT